MLKFLIDIFCKDTVIGLCPFDDIFSHRIYKNRQNRLFSKNYKKIKRISMFIDPMACYL